MAFTPKQERNGATGSTETHNTAAPGPSVDIAAVMAESVAAATPRQDIGHELMLGHGAPSSQVVDWETFMAVDEQVGEA